MRNRILNSFIVVAAAILLFSCESKVTNKQFENVDALVESVKSSITEISVDDMKVVYEGDEPYLIIDVREGNEFNNAYIPGAINIPRGLIEFRIAKESYWEEEMLYMPLKEELIFVCCKKGHRGALAAAALQSMGYTNVKNVAGGVNAWKAAYPDLVEKNEVAGGAPMMGASAGSDDGGC